MTEQKAIILDQPWQIELYRLNVLKHRLRLEIKGLTFRGPSTLGATNETLIRNGIISVPCRTKVKALATLEAYITTKEQEAGLT